MLSHLSVLGAIANVPSHSSRRVTNVYGLAHQSGLVCIPPYSFPHTVAAVSDL